jgi:hypothetical protein
MFESFAWTPVLFWIAVVVSIIVLWFISESIGVLLLALVGYMGINWNMWSGVSLAFWIVWFIGLALFVAHWASKHRYARYATLSAPWAARVALGIVVVMALLSVLRHFGWLPDTIHLTWWWLFWALVVAVFVVLVLALVRNAKLLAGIAALVLLALVLVGGLAGLLSGNHDNEVATPATSSTSSSSVPSQSPSSSSSPVPVPSPTAACPTTWEIKYLNHSGNRVVYEGIASIQNATTRAQARAAANDVLHKVQTDPINLSGYIAYFLRKNVSPDALMTADKKCASDAAGSYVAQLELVMANAEITPGNAPENGTNSGVDNGTVVSSTTVGITGNRKAIKVVFKDENGVTHVVWILARCGNPVTTGKAPVPHGKTEKQPPPTKTPPSKKCDSSKMPHRVGSVVLSNCTYKKVDQSDGCKLNASGCRVPNVFVHEPQHNTGQSTGTTTGAPATPTSSQSSATAPGGSSGTSTGTPSGTHSCDPALGCGSDHSAPTPTTTIP